MPQQPLSATDLIAIHDALLPLGGASVEELAARYQLTEDMILAIRNGDDPSGKTVALSERMRIASERQREKQRARRERVDLLAERLERLEQRGAELAQLLNETRQAQEALRQVQKSPNMRWHETQAQIGLLQEQINHARDEAGQPSRVLAELLHEIKEFRASAKTQLRIIDPLRATDPLVGAKPQTAQPTRGANPPANPVELSRRELPKPAPARPGTLRRFYVAADDFVQRHPDAFFPGIWVFGMTSTLAINLIGRVQRVLLVVGRS